MFNPSRLTIARKRRKFTGKALADEAGLTAAIEKGRAMSLEQALAFASDTPEKLPG